MKFKFESSHDEVKSTNGPTLHFKVVSFCHSLLLLFFSLLPFMSCTFCWSTWETSVLTHNDATSKFMPNRQPGERREGGKKKQEQESVSDSFISRSKVCGDKTDLSECVMEKEKDAACVWRKEGRRREDIDPTSECLSHNYNLYKTGSGTLHRASALLICFKG